MALYNYQALNDRGRKVIGQLNANNELDLTNRLQQMGLELLRAKEQKQGGRGGLAIAQSISTRDLVQMCVHLEQLNLAGVPMLDGLADVRDSTDKRRLKDLMSEIHSDVSEGKSLSEAFGRHPKVFGHVFTSLLAAGEESGNLTESFQQLIKHLKWNDEINRKVKKATRYPSFMLIAIVGLFMFMMIMVVPEVVGFLKASGKELPMITLSLIATSDFVTDYWYAMLGMPVGLVMLLMALRKSSSQMAYRIDALLLRLPVFGEMTRKISLSRFAHFFAVMFKSGVPILTCLDTAAKVVSNRVLFESLARVRQDVQEGNPLSRGLTDSGEFPSLVIRMVKVGEESGNLGETLENVTAFYDDDVNESVDGLIGMIEPTLTAVAGGMMAWIVAGVIGPIYDSFSQMGG